MRSLRGCRLFWSIQPLQKPLLANCVSTTTDQHLTHLFSQVCRTSTVLSSEYLEFGDLSLSLYRCNPTMGTSLSANRFYTERCQAGHFISFSTENHSTIIKEISNNSNHVHSLSPWGAASLISYTSWPHRDLKNTINRPHCHLLFVKSWLMCSSRCVYCYWWSCT